MPSDDAKFACPSCGKQYRWKPEMSGRTAKCACGAKLVVPAEPATAPAPKAPPAPPQSASPACPSCGAPLAANAVICVACGYNLKTGQKLSLVVEDAGDEEDDESVASPATKKSPG